MLAARAWTRMAAELADADRRQREFVANVSHELRTPISALHALLENLADGVTQAQPEVMRTALDQTARLGRLIAQLLDLSRMDSGADPLDRAEFDAAPFLSAIATQTRIGHPATRFRIEVDDGLSVHGDRDRLHQVVSNLLDNAAVHGPPDGTVTVSSLSDLRDGTHRWPSTCEPRPLAQARPGPVPSAPGWDPLHVNLVTADSALAAMADCPARRAGADLQTHDHAAIVVHHWPDATRAGLGFGGAISSP